MTAVSYTHLDVYKRQAWYAYEGDKIGQGRENAKTYIHENPAFFDMLEAKVMDFYFTQPDDCLLYTSMW